MWTWKAILLSAAAAIATSASLLWPGLMSKSEVLFFLQDKWPELSLIGLAAYGLSMVIFSVAHILWTSRRGSRWFRCYMFELIKGQYWTAVLILFVLEAMHTSLEVTWPLPPSLLMHPALTAVATLLLTGLIGLWVIGVALVAPSPRRRGMSSSIENLEIAMGEIRSLLQTRAPQNLALPADDWRVSLRDAIEALVQETSRLRKEVSAATEELRNSRQPERSGQIELGEIAMLRDAAVSIEQSVPKLAQIAESVSAAASGNRDVATASAGIIAEELDELLRDVREGSGPQLAAPE